MTDQIIYLCLCGYATSPPPYHKKRNKITLLQVLFIEL